MARVLFVLKDSTVNGLTREVSYFARRLPLVGWDPFVAVLRGGGADRRSAELDVGPIFSCSAERDGLERASERLVGHVATVKPHIVYAYIDSVVALQRLASLRPHVLVVKAEGRKIMEGRAERRELYRRLGAMFDRIVVTSTAMRDRLQEFEAVRDRCVLLPSAVDTDVFVPSLEKERAKRLLGLPLTPVCLNVARLVPHKRPSRFVRLAKVARALTENEQLRPTFVWVGGGEAIEESRKARIQRRAGVIFVPTQSDVRPYYAAADVFVMTSRDESAPNALLEAMSSGIPVLTTRSYDSITEVVARGTGYVCDDPRAAAAHLVELLAAPERMSAMGRLARQHVQVKFSLNARMRQFCSVFSVASNPPQ